MMRYSYYIFIVLLTAFSLQSCEDKAATDTDEDSSMSTEGNVDQGGTTPANAAIANVRTLPSVPRAAMENLWNNAHSIDYIMTSLPFSLSTSDLEQSRAMMMHISTDSSAVFDNCEKTATISYVGDSGILMEADLYYSLTDTRCNYFVFYQNGQPAYANRLTEQGFNYYQQIVTQVRVEPEQ